MAGPVQVKRRGFLMVAAADEDDDDDDDASPDSSLVISLPLPAEGVVICLHRTRIPAAVSRLLNTDRQVGSGAETERKQRAVASDTK
jgi:hypothetical protein